MWEGTYIYWLFHCLKTQRNKRHATKPTNIWKKKQETVVRILDEDNVTNTSDAEGSGLNKQTQVK